MVWSIGEAILSPVLTAYAADISPKSKAGAAMSLTRQTQDIVFLLGPLGLGLVYDTFPGSAAMVATAGLTLAGGALFRLRAKDVTQL
eukprot:TRINITY_DN72960_c0_g1_i1.p1 TRINITY_DN72960_c0_g1~~TRINITY_DN72960_c0_g1_i1.p1  ORF type:complete len:101 (+),score=6.96 TRINITY_DN72960_c0_g1_i1:43-303(+)